MEDVRKVEARFKGQNHILQGYIFHMAELFVLKPVFPYPFERPECLW